jgi:asparagine synthase (glutamine-hydrolysing)
MCGIAGIFDIAGPVQRSTIERFTDALAHRGPDGRGVHIDRGVALGHRRLAILDPRPEGNCPMEYTAPSGRRSWITFNGEVYNFLEIKRELESEGWRFKTRTDTEVLAASWARWGKDCLTRFNGMWAFAIWTPETNELVICRDRFGVKPLYYYTDSHRLAFASEAKAFLMLDGFVPELDLAAAGTVMTHGPAAEGCTDRHLLKGVRRLPAGHLLTINNHGELKLERWWDTASHIPSVPQSFGDQVDAFREILLDAVRIRMRSDVPVGSCLSGGIDSSAVVSCMSLLHSKGALGERVPQDWRQTFVASFPGTVLDEKLYAEQVIKATGVRAYIWEFNPDEALQLIADSVWSLENVYGGLVVPVWCIYREMRRAGTVVSLDGHGSDEMLMGYTWYLDWPVHEVNQRLYNDFHYSLLPAILRNYDRCSMAHGIEVRMPFMDWRLVTFCFGLPPLSKAGDGFTKRVLRAAMRGIVPDSILDRRTKIGFNSPMIEWFNGGLGNMVDRFVQHPLWRDSPFWNGPEMAAKALAKSSAKQWTTADWGFSLETWTRMNLVLWHMMFIEGVSPSDIMEVR